LAASHGKLLCRAKRPRRAGWHSRTASQGQREGALRRAELSKRSNSLAGMNAELPVGLKHKPAREAKGTSKVGCLSCLVSLQGLHKPSRGTTAETRSSI